MGRCEELLNPNHQSGSRLSVGGATTEDPVPFVEGHPHATPEAPNSGLPFFSWGSFKEQYSLVPPDWEGVGRSGA